MVEIDPRLTEHREQWKRKPTLRLIYEDYHRRILSTCRPGQTLEIGAGSGHMAAFTDDVVSLDILMAPWLDLVADAQRLPFKDGTFDNIVLLDVLHHIPDPGRFFAEAQRLLRPGGRIAMIEPGITPLSWPFFHFFHPELVDLAADPLAPAADATDRDPFDSNQAVPTSLFKRRGHRRRFGERFPQLRVVSASWLSLIAYPLSGGFRPWTLMPAWLTPLVLRVERFLLPVVGPLGAFRLHIVLERR